MSKKLNKTNRKARVRKKLRSSSAEKIRLSVFRSSNHIYAQIIDDNTGKTLAYASSLNNKNKKEDGNIGSASVVGELIAERSIKAGVKKVYFDRGGYKYHGRVKALAEKAREKGLEF